MLLRATFTTEPCLCCRVSIIDTFDSANCVKTAEEWQAHLAVVIVFCGSRPKVTVDVISSGEFGQRGYCPVNKAVMRCEITCAV